MLRMISRRFFLFFLPLLWMICVWEEEQTDVNTNQRLYFLHCVRCFVTYTKLRSSPLSSCYRHFKANNLRWNTHTKELLSFFFNYAIDYLAPVFHQCNRSLTTTSKVRSRWYKFALYWKADSPLTLSFVRNLETTSMYDLVAWRA